MKLTVVSLREKLFEGEAKSFTIQTASGEITVLDHHRPLITILKKGTAIVVSKDGKKNSINVAGGFLEVANNEVTALIDAYHEKSILT